MMPQENWKVMIRSPDSVTYSLAIFTGVLAPYTLVI